MDSSTEPLFGDLIFVAWKQAEIRARTDITLKDLAARVGAELGETYAAQSALGWRMGSKPRPRVIAAIAKVLGADEAALQAAKRGVTPKPPQAQDDAGETSGLDIAQAERRRVRGPHPASPKGARSIRRGKKGE